MCEAGSLLVQCKVLWMSCLDLTIWQSPLLAVAAALVKPVVKWSMSRHVAMHHGDRSVTTQLHFIYGRAQTLQREVGMVKMGSQRHWAWSWLMNVNMVWIILSHRWPMAEDGITATLSMELTDECQHGVDYLISSLTHGRRWDKRITFPGRLQFASE